MPLHTAIPVTTGRNLERTISQILGLSEIAITELSEELDPEDPEEVIRLADRAAKNPDGLSLPNSPSNLRARSRAHFRSTCVLNALI